MPSLIFKIMAPAMNLLPERQRLQLIYFLKQRSRLELDAPRTFNEWLQHKKIYSADADLFYLTDKLIVKKFIHSLNLPVKIPQTIWQGNSLSEITKLNLPEKYVLKSNHASGTNLIVVGDNKPTLTDLRKYEKEWKKINLSKTYVEAGYSRISQRFFVEEYLDFSSFVPLDFKFWVIGGRVAMVQVDSDRFENHKRVFYSSDWNILPISLRFPKPSYDIEKPGNFPLMMKVAESIGSAFDFVRVDLYSNDVDVFFGEVTLYPDSGFSRFSPRSFDKELFEKIQTKSYLF